MEEKTIQQGQDVLSWEYETDYFRDRSTRNLLMVIFGIIIILFWVMGFLAMGRREEFRQITIWTLVAAVVILGGTWLIWFLVAKAKNGSRLRYAMDQEHIWQILTDRQIRRDKALGTMNSIAGFLGTGPNSYNMAHLGTQMETGAYRQCEFSRVVSVKCIPKYDKFHIRDIDKTMVVYVGTEDYARVKQYIIQHVPQGVKVK